jgi:hypothetical protein
MTAVRADEAIGPRLARLESHTAYALSKAGDLQLDVREMRSDIREVREQMLKEIAALRADIDMLRRKLRW